MTDYYDGSLFGSKSMTYEFTVSGGTDRHFKIVGPYIGERSHHSAIIWAADSSSVQFAFDGVEIQVKP